MKFKIIVSLFLLTTVSAFSQELKCKSGGRIFDSNNQKLSSKEIRELLANQPEILQVYNDGRSEKILGNALMYGGIALAATDLIVAATKEGEYPTALTVAGAAAIFMSVPIKYSSSKKLKNVVNDYNSKLSKKDTGFNFESMSIVSNGKGLGLRITF